MSFKTLYDKVDFSLGEKKVRLQVVACTCIMIFIIFCNSKYFTIGDYFIFPIITVILLLIDSFIRLRKKEKIIFSSEHYYILFMLFYTIAIRLLSDIPQKNDTFFTFLIFWCLIFLCQINNFTLREIRFLIKGYLLSAIILSMVLIIQHKLPYPNEMRFAIFYNSEDFYDVNFLAAYLVFPALIFLEKLFYNLSKNIKYINIFNIVGFLLISTATLLTGSRGSFVVLLLGCAYIVIKNYDKYNFKIILYILPFVIIVGILLFPREVIERLLFNNYNDGSNQKRILHWKLALQTFQQNSIFGYGMIWTIDVINSVTGKAMTAHNTIFGFLLQYGVVGGATLIMWGITLLKVFWRNKCYLLIFFILSLMFVLVMIEAQTSLVFLIPLLLLTIIQRYINMNKNNTEKIKEILL